MEPSVHSPLVKHLHCTIKAFTSGNKHAISQSWVCIGQRWLGRVMDSWVAAFIYQWKLCFAIEDEIEGNGREDGFDSFKYLVSTPIQTRSFKKKLEPVCTFSFRDWWVWSSLSEWRHLYCLVLNCNISIVLSSSCRGLKALCKPRVNGYNSGVHGWERHLSYLDCLTIPLFRTQMSTFTPSRCFIEALTEKPKASLRFVHLWGR